MAIDRATVEHVARLARLALSDEERERFAEQLGRILEHCALLDAQPIEGVPPSSHVMPITNVLRDDAVTPSLPREEVLAQAPAHEGGFFHVPGCWRPTPTRVVGLVTRSLGKAAPRQAPDFTGGIPL